MFLKDLGGKQLKAERDGEPVEFKEMFMDPLTKKQLFNWFLSKHLPHIEAATGN